MAGVMKGKGGQDLNDKANQLEPSKTIMMEKHQEGSDTED